MLHVFRETFGRYVAIVIIALIGVTFIFFGIDFTMTQSRFAARVNGDSIPIQEFERILRIEESNYQLDLRVELTDDLRRAIRQSVLDRMIVRELLRQRAESAGYRVSDARVRDSLASDPTFQAGGRFSQDVYVALLAQQGLSPAGYEEEQRQLLTIVEWQDALLRSSFVTPSEFRHQIELVNERRELAYAVFAADDFVDEVEVSDEDVAAYHAENADLFMSEEAVDIEYVELDLASIAATVEISEQTLRDYYEDEIERYAVSEERHVRHILIEPEGDDYQAAEAEADAVLARLEAGEDFSELAAEVSDDAGTRNDGGDLGWMARGVLEGPFEDALFAMEVGDIEGPVETEFGYHILKLDDIRASDTQPFEAVRDQLYQELSSDQAYTTFLDRANELRLDAYDARDDLTGVAEDFGLELKTIEGLTRSGNTDQFVDPTPIIAVAFDDAMIATGENSDLIELSEELVAVVRVKAHYLPEPLPFEDVADDIRSTLEFEMASERAGEAATAYFEALNADLSGDVLARAEALAAESGATWNAAQWVQRSSVTVPSTLVMQVFNQPRPVDGEPLLLRNSVGAGDQAVVLLTRVEPGVPDDVTVDEREDWQAQLREDAASIEINAFATDARENARIRVPDDVLNPPGL